MKKTVNGKSKKAKVDAKVEQLKGTVMPVAAISFAVEKAKITKELAASSAYTKVKEAREALRKVGKKVDEKKD